MSVIVALHKFDMYVACASSTAVPRLSTSSGSLVYLLICCVFQYSSLSICRQGYLHSGSLLALAWATSLIGQPSFPCILCSQQISTLPTSTLHDVSSSSATLFPSWIVLEDVLAGLAPRHAAVVCARHSTYKNGT